MSAYITFYIRSRSGGPYIELESFPRSSYIYQYIGENVQYGTTRLLKKDDLREAIDAMADVITNYEKQLADCEETVKFLQGMKEISYDERLDHYYSIQRDMQEIRENIDDVKESMDHLRTYMGILGTHQWVSEDYAAAADLYIAHENDPNYPDDDEENEKETE
jgi:superfamily II RNA helicase